ncbi:MAG: hypothetical protein ACRDTG_25190 [Pseudonocardiaceae bacterium]
MHRPQDEVVPLHEPFEIALRGFNRQQVLAHIESLDGRITMVMKDRESALAQVAELSRTIDQLREESELLAHLRRATEKVHEQAELAADVPIVGASIRIQRIVRLAEEEAVELKTRAEQEASELRKHAEQDAAACRKHATSEAEVLLRDMTQRCKQLEADSEHRRKAADQNAEREIAQRETEAADRLRARDQRGLAGLHLLLKIVVPRLAERISVVEQAETTLAESRTRTGREVAALEAFRAEVTTQLSTTRQVVAEALEQVQQIRIDDTGPAQPHPVPSQRDGHPAGKHAVGSRITSKP